MFRSLHAGSTEVLIGPPGEIGGSERVFDDVAEADSYLRALVDDAGERDALRAVVVATASSAAMLSDTAIREVAAGLLVARNLGVREAMRMPGGILLRAGASWLAPASPSLPRDRLSLTEIARRYTTPEDSMQEWSQAPMLAALFDGYVVQITATEARLLDGLGLGTQIAMNEVSGLAREIAARHFPGAPPAPPWVPPDRYNEWIGNDGHRDALRHSLWNALMTVAVGAATTEAFTTAHEGVPGNQPLRRAMDLYNNQQGRRMAGLHPRADPEEMAIHLRGAMDRGELILFDQTGALAWSNQVALYRHGLAPPTPRP